MFGYNTKFSGLANKDMYGRQLGELFFSDFGSEEAIYPLYTLDTSTVSCTDQVHTLYSVQYIILKISLSFFSSSLPSFDKETKERVDNDIKSARKWIKEYL